MARASFTLTAPAPALRRGSSAADHAAPADRRARRAKPRVARQPTGIEPVGSGQRIDAHIEIATIAIRNVRHRTRHVQICRIETAHRPTAHQHLADLERHEFEHRNLQDVPTTTTLNINRHPLADAYVLAARQRTSLTRLIDQGPRPRRRATLGAGPRGAGPPACARQGVVGSNAGLIDSSIYKSSGAVPAIIQPISWRRWLARA